MCPICHQAVQGCPTLVKSHNTHHLTHTYIMAHHEYPVLLETIPGVFVAEPKDMEIELQLLLSWAVIATGVGVNASDK